MLSIFKNRCFSYLILGAFFFCSCKKFVEVDAPPNQLVTSNVFSNDITATGAVLNIYWQMQPSESYYLSQNTGLLSDELTNYSSNFDQILFYKNSLSSIQPAYTGPWQNAYNYIYQANNIVEGLNKYSGVAAPIKSQLIGEAKFIRAFWFFYLTNLYGDIPLTISTSYTVNSQLSRSAKSDVYKQIVADLKDAQSLLNDNYVDGTDTTVTSERIRPNKGAATALLARVYLFQGDYVNAETESSNVINNGLYHLEADLNHVFLTTSQEAIWQLGIQLPFSGGSNTLDASFYIYNNAPINNAGISISLQLINAFEPGDYRKANWVGSYTTPDPPINTYYYPFKYHVFNSNDVSEYITVLRLAEQYLIRAEARVQGAGSGIVGAIDDIDTIRSRAGLSPYNGAADKFSVLSAILQERRVELFTEWGHRWFDLNRTGSVDTVMGGPNGATAKKGGMWDSHDKLYPIPEKEIMADRYLSQNNGYQ